MATGWFVESLRTALMRVEPYSMPSAVRPASMSATICCLSMLSLLKELMWREVRRTGYLDNLAGFPRGPIT